MNDADSLPKTTPQNHALSLRRVITNDYWSFVGVAYPAFTWAGYLIFVLIGSGAEWLGRPRPAAADSAPIFLAMAAFFTGIGLPMLIWRWLRLSSIFSNGQEAPGKISKVDFARELIRVDFTYTYQGKPRQGRASVHRTAQTRQAQPRDRVTVIVHRDHPQQAFIRDWMCTPVEKESRAEGIKE
jgi:hypothetical protein